MEELSSTEHKSVVDESSSIVLSLLKRECVGAHCQMLSERVRRLSERALQRGLECSRCATHKLLSQALKGGAGPVHSWCGKGEALPKLPLVIRDSQGNFTADPQCVAELYAHEWKREWGGEDAMGFVKEINSIRALLEKHVAEARVWASNLDLRAEHVRKACLSVPSKTAIGLDQHAFRHRTPPRQCLGIFGRDHQTMFCQVGHSNSVTFATFGLVGQEKGGSRTIALLHTTYRLTMRLVPAHISQWDVKFAGKWDPALKGNSALRANVGKAVGIELAHIGGQSVIHVLWDMRKFYDSIKAHLLIPQLVARDYPLEILVLGPLTHRSQRCLQVGNGYSDIITGCASSIASSILAGCLQSCSWARGLLFELVQALGYVVSGSVCEEHIDYLSQFVTRTCRIQLFHDAALVGKTVEEGTAKLGLTLSCNSTLLANDKSLRKLVVGHLGDEGVPICLGTSATDLGKRICASNQWKRIWKGRRRTKRVHRPCKTNSEAQKLTMTHTPCSNLRPHRARSPPHRSIRYAKTSKRYGDGQNPCVRYFHGRMVLRRKASATNCHPS